MWEPFSMGTLILDRHQMLQERLVLNEIFGLCGLRKLKKLSTLKHLRKLDILRKLMQSRAKIAQET